MPARKRAAEEPATARSGTSSRRRSGRISDAPKKSSYWEGSDDDESGAFEKPMKKRKSGASNGLRASAAARKQESDGDEYTAEAQTAEEEDEGDDEGFGEQENENRPMKVTVVPLEKLRDDGGVPYEDHKVHKNTLLFLKELKANNRRPWLKAHDGEYRRALRDWQTFVEASSLTVSDADATVPAELPAKDVAFRIYRDTRFSRDPTPYKPHFAAAWSRTGRKGPYACYYVHCEPGSSSGSGSGGGGAGRGARGRSFIGGGLWHPEAGHVRKLRRSVDRHPERWRAVLGEERLRRVFFPQVKASTKGGGGGVEEAAVKAFVGKNQENALKKRPMGYEATHPDIELLKLKNYTIGVPIDDDMLCGDDAQEKFAEYIGAMEGYITFLNSIVMPDPGLDQSDSEDDSNEDDDQDND
ncbi:hypothetical protein ISF_02266 [Cordyceps fumosorosea ARSEF 2679]|uniref:TIGR02453 family protein n=1 Tax=Cordyceps fumosorosea (strain ARSEF 2679) TaxID=1081104 RepID=A0A162JKF9_CORFA|nr:hypothetical protein ISF_02266 [Cordyceps fumosorosea ARSEF 2679]OAA70292.1 hypothetical protein ISF_02266 [Cordyceps fumosorosea ARSEF 2679]